MVKNLEKIGDNWEHLGGLKDRSDNVGKSQENYYKCLDNDNRVLKIVPTQIRCQMEGKYRKKPTKTDSDSDTTTVTMATSIDQLEETYEGEWCTIEENTKKTADFAK